MGIECLNYGSLPRAGGWADQDDDEMLAINIALRAKKVYTKKDRGEEWDQEDSKFIAWVEEEDEDG